MDTTVLCLANSKKEGERCIAGIDVSTGQWVRPVSRHTPKGEVPFRERQVSGQEPQLLDLILMDLAHEGPTGFEYCHAKENRWIDPHPWSKSGSSRHMDLLPYLSRDRQILHSHTKYTRPDQIEVKPLADRTTLELRQVTSLQVDYGSGKWKATLVTAEQIRLHEISVTDCLLIERLKRGESVGGSGYACLSLGMPWMPPMSDWDQGAVGWKLLAGWIPAET
jgi:hypothetical protein